jgi:O-antigen/teichoic acid export membrane protein
LLSSGISAVYFNGTQNIPFLPILMSAASSAVLLQLGNRQQEDNTNHAVLLANQTGRLLSCVVFPLFFFLLFFRYEIYDLLYKGKYMQSVPIFFVSLFMLPVRAYSFTTILQHKHKGGMINTGAIAELLLACILMYPLYQLMGLPGLALSFVISTYLQAVFYLVVTANTLRVTFFSLIPLTNWILKLIVFATVFIGIRYLFQQYLSTLISLTLGTVMCIICIFISLSIELKAIKKHA